MSTLAMNFMYIAGLAGLAVSIGVLGYLGVIILLRTLYEDTNR